MTNTETAKMLMDLANVYGTTPDEIPLSAPLTTAHVNTKQAVIDLIKAVGGKFKKEPLYEGADTMLFRSARIPGFDIWVPRDKICRKIPARYECEPLFSAAEDAEIMEVAEAGK